MQTRSSSPILHNIFSLIPLLFYFFNLLRITKGIILPFIIIELIGGIYGIFLLIFKRKYHKKILISLFLIYFVSCFISPYFSNNRNIFGSIFSVFCFGVGIVMLNHPIRFCYGKICFWVTALWMFLYFLMGVPNDQVFINSSENYISVILIIAAAFYYVGLYNSGKKISIVSFSPAVISFMLSVWGNGRGGILCTLLLNVLVFFSYIHQKRNKGKDLFLVRVLVFSVLCIMVFAGGYLLDTISNLGNMSKGMESSREIIWLSYYEEMSASLTNFLFGVPYSEMPMMIELENNTHNSFIQLHAECGFFAFAIFLILTINSFKYYLSTKKQLLFAMVFTIFARCLTDVFAFSEIGMPIFLYLILYQFIEESSMQKTRVNPYRE